ncbi:MAG: FAD-binding oxidoreductase [Xanthobacteraceae bacterium]
MPIPVQLTRRSALRRLAVAAVFAPAVLSGRRAFAQLPALPKLPPSEATLLHPGDAQFDGYVAAFNSRTVLTPQLRALCRTPQAIGVMVGWCRDYGVPFALRGRGHCFEGFSESSSVVIDTRPMRKVTVDSAAKIATVSAGASLGDVYIAAGAHGLAFPGGSCPTVGIAGHALGGGYGFLARPFGLACDNVLSVDLIDPQGRVLRADRSHNPDLFWACRGGGGGSFGAVTGFRLQLHSLKTVITFSINWRQLTPARAADVLKVWQLWAPNAPSAISGNLVINRHPEGGINLHCAGQSIGTLAELKRELKALPGMPRISAVPMIAAINDFAGGVPGWIYASSLMKGKSDYVTAPLTNGGRATLMEQINGAEDVYVICDAYGGAISRVAADATAFAHRGSTLFSIQYATYWTDPAQTPQRLAVLRKFYAAMRPHVSGGAYVNYCDVDLKDWPTAYWGQNLARLKRIKMGFDPDNVFQHSQSVPSASSD